MNGLSRREFLRRSAVVAGAGVAAGGVGVGAIENAWAGRQPGPGDVVRVVHPGMMPAGRVRPDPAVARQMVHEAVKRLCGETDLGAAFRRFVAPTEKVGIKPNCLAGQFSSTSRAVVDAIVDGVRAVGVPDDRILIFDQYPGNMAAAGFPAVTNPRLGQIRVYPHNVLGYEDREVDVHGAHAKLCRSLLWCDAIVSVPVIKDHDLSGVTCAVKNIVAGVIDRPPNLHRTINESLARYYALDVIRPKIRLIVCDASMVLYNGGPRHNDDYRSRQNAVYATTDPIAMDTLAWELIESLRRERHLRTLEADGRPPLFLRAGAEMGLGVAERSRIRLEDVPLS